MTEVLTHTAPSPPLVGRDEELSTLTRLAGVARPPSSGSVLLSGDAGIGKSRLLAALAARAGEQGWRVATGHCFDLGGSPVPYLPFTEVAARLEANRPELMGRLAQRWPALRRLLVGRPGGATSADPVDRAAFFESLHAVLTEVGRDAPLLLVLEDLHWADRSTCDLLSYLFTRGFPVPVSVVASYRSDDLHRRHPLRAIAAGWSRLPGVERLELGPLPDDQTRKLVATLHPEPLAAADLRTVLDRAEGNAFFVEELVAAVGSAAVPRDLAGLLLLRLDPLEADARLVVRAAAAGGRQVRDELLAAVTGLPPDRFETAVRSAVEYLVLVAEGDGYRFRHSMLAEAVYDDLLPGERGRLHTAYVVALRASPRSAGADLARHALAAGDRATAYAASVQAGDDAVIVGGPDEAARHYAVALDLATDLAGTDLAGTDLAGETATGLVTLTEKAAAAAAASGQVVRAHAMVADQLRRLPADAAPEHRARLLIALTEAALYSDASTNLAGPAGEAVALLPAEPPTTLRARAVSVMALALVTDRRDPEALRWVEEGLAMPPQLRRGEATAQLQTVLARVSERGGKAGESERLLRELLVATQAAGDPSEVRVLYQLASLELEQGELASALDTFRRASQRSSELGRPFAPYAVESLWLAGLTAYQLGHWDLALSLATPSTKDLPEPAAAGLAAIKLAVHAGRGVQGEWPTLLAATRAGWETDGITVLHSAAAAIDLYGDAGDLAAAEAAYTERSERLGQMWGRPDFQGQIRLVSLLLGQTAAAAPHLDAAQRRERLERAEQLAAVAAHARGVGRRPDPGLESQAWLARSRAELVRLRSAAGEAVEADEAVAAWREATAAFERYGQPFEQARSQARLAAALRLSGHGEEARQVARDAERVAVALGARPLLAELRPLTGTRPATESAGLLTPRETEVLQLVAAGRSNREIGAALYVSTKTASVHVSNIMAKLSARTRTEAAAIARRRGLVG